MKSHMFKTVLTLCCLLLLSGLSSAQNERIQAWETSQAWEAVANYEKAIGAVETAYSEQDYPANLRMGWLLYLAGDHIQSQNYYAKAIALEPDAIEARFGFILPAAALENWESVIEQYETILRIDPSNTVAHYRLGSIHYYRERYDEARTHLEKVLSLYPFDFDALSLMGWTELAAGNKVLAKELFERSLLNRPGDESSKEGLIRCQ